MQANTQTPMSRHHALRVVQESTRPLRHQLPAQIVERASTHRRPHPALAHRAMQANTPSCWGQPCLRNVKRVILGRLRNCRHPDARLVPQESTQSRVLVLCCADLATQASIRTRWVQAHPAYASRATLGPTRRHHRPSAHSVRQESTPEQVPILVPAALLESSRPPGEQHPQAHVHRATLEPTRRHHRPSAHSVRRESTPDQVVPILVLAVLLESSRPPGEQHPQAHVQIVPLA